MPIVTVPHPALRQKAKSIERLDKRTIKIIGNLEKSLLNTQKRSVSGVGLAGPQIAQSLAVFCTLLPDESGKPMLRTFINPIMIDHPTQLIMGETPRHRKPLEEGCLSIPKLWGAVPRWTWTKYQYQVAIDGELVDKEEIFSNFAARVMQHEFDHLHGILFTDYSLQLDLPVFRLTDDGRYLEIDKRELEKW